jgi:phosphate:Na+ symporter
MESLGDSGEAISRLLTRKYDHGKKLDADMTAKVDGMLALVRNAYDVMLEDLGNKNLRNIQNAYDAEDAINKCRDRLREEHIANIENRAYDYTSGVYYIDLIAELEKIGDFIINISEAAVQMR